MKKRIAKALLIAVATLSVSATAEANTLDDYHEYIPEICEEYGISECLVEALILTESSGNPKAVSSCGAIGLCQVRPECHTARMDRLGVTDLYDQRSNILVAVDYIMELAEKYQDVYLVLVAYNAGEYSKTFKGVLEGDTNAFADKVLRITEELELERYGE